MKVRSNCTITPQDRSGYVGDDATFTITYTCEVAAALEGKTTQEEVASGDAWTAPTDWGTFVSGDDEYGYLFTPESIDAVTEDTTVTVSLIS